MQSGAEFGDFGLVHWELLSHSIIDINSVE
jgi:hypothetical protein